jgi:tetratricopeptide (TPR) repeat protein
MKKLLFIFLLLTITPSLFSQTKPEQHLWGVCTRDSLLKVPYNVWFKKNYDNYQPQITVIETLKQQNLKDFKIKIFFGTWCGDTKREMPCFLKILDHIGFSETNITFIATSMDEKFRKQSNKGEEKGYDIFRVPTFVIEKNGVEVNRILEFPVFSLEKDLLTIFSNQPYQHNYFAYAHIKKWLQDGSLADDNISHLGLAMLVKPYLKSESDLNTAAYVLMAQGKMKEAVKILKMNYNLFPESANSNHSLAEGLFEKGDKKDMDLAFKLVENGLKINKDPEMVKAFLDLHKKIVQNELKFD